MLGVVYAVMVKFFKLIFSRDINTAVFRNV